MKTKEEAQSAFRAYYKTVQEWEAKTGRDLEAALIKIMNHNGDLSIEQRAVIGVAMVLCEKYGLDKPIGDLSLK